MARAKYYDKTQQKWVYADVGGLTVDQADLLYIKNSEIGVANGIPSLGADGKILNEYLKITFDKTDNENVEDPTIPGGGGGTTVITVNADWNQTDTTASDYIKNKPKLAGKNIEGQMGGYVDPDGNSMTYTAKTGAEVFNDLWGNIAAGEYSHAEGDSTHAIGNASHAEGNYTRANGNYSHAEGSGSIASGVGAHAEGGSRASGAYSHAENSSSVSANYSHSEGYGTKANTLYQHVQGTYNIPDESDKAYLRGTYAHIVGNGEDSSSLSNAHTLDWNGNAWFAGDIYVGSNSGTNKDEGSKKVATIFEEWTITFEDGSTETKKVYVG